MTSQTASAAAWELVAAHERSASVDEREIRGAWYTPRRVVDAVVSLAFGPSATGGDAWIPDRVVDPTCGAGAFLLGTLDRLVGSGIAASDALGRVSGTDIDRGAVAACRDVLAVWASEHHVERTQVEEAKGRIQVGDALASSWPEPYDNAGLVTLVIGNPPFATPLRGRPFPEAASAFREQRKDLFGPYADLAVLHLAAALDGLGVGDRLALILPQSVVSSRDVAGLRAACDEQAPVVDAWATDELVFDANVRVWAPLLEVGASGGSDPWRLVVADALGGPIVQLDGEPLGDRVVATAGFRDEYYGVAEVCREEDGAGRVPHEMIVATVGSLDPLITWWGVKPTTFAKQRWDRPVVDPADLTGRVARWVEQMQRPKVLVPTQSKVFEPVIDRDGIMVPVTPVLALWPNEAWPEPSGERLSVDHLAALLLAPPLVAWARRNWFGAALSTSAIKLPAAGLAELPMPLDPAAWNEAAAMIAERLPSAGGRRRDRAAGDVAAVEQLVDDVAVVMNRAYGAADDAVLEWWRARR